MQTYGDSLATVFKDKYFRSVERITVFCEYFGAKSFAGLHFPDDPKQVVLFDVNVHKRGFMIPRDFINYFGHLKTPKIVYEGNFGPQLIKDVREGKFGFNEGVVAKGVIQGKRGRPEHGLWFAKIKTEAWMNELKNRAAMIPSLQRTLEDNMKEQKL